MLFRSGVWAQTKLNGQFSLNLEARPAPGDDGTFYRLTANPNDWSGGYSRVEKVVEMRDVVGDATLEWCPTTTNAFGLPVECDVAAYHVTGDFEIALRGANFVGVVTNSLDGDSPIPWIFVEVVQPSAWGGWTWLTAASTNNSGVFRAAIELASTDPNLWTKITVRVNPPWGSEFPLVQIGRAHV